MAFDWKDYYKLATTLSGAGDEASKRTAISRGYYFAYHLALNRAKARHYSPTRVASSHKQLWEHYENNSNRDSKMLALLGGRMKRRRVKADYEDNFPRIEDAVDEIIADAQRCEAILGALPAGIP
jgi:uncharacterized protein (UPF0332 family)